MLTPMLVQYVVGLCCLRRNPDAVDVTVGDMVLDVAAEKRRDMDITVTLKESDGTIRAFKAYEVKREGEPLDVATVEQLCMKFYDMPTVTHRAIVSASDFTSGAIAKAKAHNVSLYVIKPWIEPMAKQFPEFKNAGTPDEFLRRFSSCLLVWINWRVQLHVPQGPASFSYENSAPLFSMDGTAHTKFATLKTFLDAVLLRSTQILLQMEPADTVLRTFLRQVTADNQEFEAGPAWPHTHTLDVGDDQVYLRVDSGSFLLKSLTISGSLQWQQRIRYPEFFILEGVPTNEVFAGAALADWGTPDGKMFAMIFSPDSRTANIHTIQLEEKHRNAIRQLKIPVSMSASAEQG
jgi:hypothetical protein